MSIKHFAALYGLLAFVLPAQSFAHAIAGDRIFPATIAVDDPGVNDELDTSIGRTHSPDGWSTAVSAEFDKRLTTNFGLSVEGSWVDPSDINGGFDNVGVGAKYTFFKSDAHEAIFSAGLDWDIGNTGATRIAERYSTLTPALFFGKGMGDLPDSMEYLKPFAVTGSLGIAFPTKRFTRDDGGDTEFNPAVLQWGATVQYSVPYLQQHVKDVGLGDVFATAVPVVEFAMETPAGGDSHRTTGTINPGILFMGSRVQLGFEAVIPVNRESGDHVGAVAQLHFYLDNIFPQTMKPLW